MRIGYLVPQFPGQTHIFFWREILALEEMGHDVHVLSTRRPPRGLIVHKWSDEAIARTTFLVQPNLLQAATAAARLVPQGLPLWMMSGGAGFARDALLALPAAQALVAYARKHELTHVHVHSLARAAVIAALARRMGGPSYSVTLHGPLSDYGPGQSFKWQGASFATVITRKLADEVRATLKTAVPERLTVRAMGIDPDALRRTRPYTPPEKGRPVRLFSCARLNVVKGHQDIMSAVRQLLDQGIDVRLEIAGEDDDGGKGFRAELEAHLKKLRLRDHVRLLGAIDATEVRAKLEDAHLFVLASWHEPLGVAYMEAMSMGVPVIGTEAGGVRELIEDGKTGYLVAPRNPGALARAVRALLQSPDALARLSRAGRAHVERNFHARLGAETLAREIALTRDHSAAADTT